MLTDADLLSIQADFGVLAAKVACNIKRGTESTNTHVVGAPWTLVTAHTCTVLNASQVKDAYLESFAKSLVQATKNPRIILMGLPIPNSAEVKRDDYIVVGSDRYKVLDTDNNSTYQYQRVLFCQWVEGSTV